MKKYIETLEKYLNDSKIDKKVQVLKGEMEKYNKTEEGEISTLIQRCKTLFEKQHKS